MYEEIVRLKKIYEFRSKFIRTVREYFSLQGVKEVDTPLVTPYFSHDLNISPLQIKYKGEIFYLATSPEFFLKRLLVSNMGDIFEITHAFRNDPITNYHNPEFLILEWYREGWKYLDLIKDLEGLLKYLSNKFSMETEYINKKWEIISLSELFYKYTHIKLEDLFNANKRKEIALKLGYSNDSFEVIFYKIFISIEEKIGKERPTVIYDYPEVLGGFAKSTEADSRFTQRIELYLKGLELANGYTEITDPIEQKMRWEKYGSQSFLYDIDFLTYLKYGMPECAGIALGLDRLMMFFLNKKDISEVMPFSFKYFFKKRGEKSGK